MQNLRYVEYLWSFSELHVTCLSNDTIVKHHAFSRFIYVYIIHKILHIHKLLHSCVSVSIYANVHYPLMKSLAHINLRVVKKPGSIDQSRQSLNYTRAPRPFVMEKLWKKNSSLGFVTYM